MFGCCTTNSFRALSRAAAKTASARWRQLGLSAVAENWAERAAACERCPLRVITAGRSYCGTPFSRRVVRDPVTDGCGCPTRDKARSPTEHCPIDLANRAAVTIGSRCTCRWCSLA